MLTFIIFLSAGWANFTQLTYLDLSYNALNGPLPVQWNNASLPLASSLKTLLLNNNSLNGSLPLLPAMSASGCWSVAGNPGLCGIAPANATCSDYTGTGIGGYLA